MDVVREDALPVDLDDRQPLAIPLLEAGVTADVDLLEVERVLGPHVLEHRPGPLAEVAAGGGKERDAGYG
jgi:hypothetical protein